jgi:methionine-rich copper-binding protein CopC
MNQRAGAAIRKALLALAVTVAVLAPGTPAWAHAQLVATDPAPGAILTASPAAVTLTFNEQLNPDFTTIVVSDAAGQRIPASDPAVAAAAGTVTLSRTLANGPHTVAYRVVSVDGHSVQGSYAFTVADPARPPASAAPAAAAPGRGAPAFAGPGGVLAGVALAATALVWYALRRRRSAR